MLLVVERGLRLLSALHFHAVSSVLTRIIRQRIEISSFRLKLSQGPIDRFIARQIKPEQLEGVHCAWKFPSKLVNYLPALRKRSPSHEDPVENFGSEESLESSVANPLFPLVIRTILREAMMMNVYLSD
jgi:hypothetical protein